ncbi:MAG: hypothetical protein EB140_08935 [Proteobacteria bacterium]|nr:hypothetical protein [Pseudomonadota bacterium]
MNGVVARSPAGSTGVAPPWVCAFSRDWISVTTTANAITVARRRSTSAGRCGGQHDRLHAWQDFGIGGNCAADELLARFDRDLRRLGGLRSRSVRARVK